VEVFRDNWRSLAFWRWWWSNSLSTEVKVPLAFVIVAMLLIAGYFAANQMSGASAAIDSSTYVQSTVRKVVTVRQHGKLVVKRVPVVIRRNVVHSQTSYQTVIDKQVVTTRGGVRRVVQKVPQFVPVERVVNVTVDHTQTVVQPVTSVVTTTVTLPPQTITQTVTVPVVSTVTVTVPATP
jgi:hypothetical protein